MKKLSLKILLIIFISTSLSTIAQDSTSSSDYTPYELLSSYYENEFQPFKKSNWYSGLSFSLQDVTSTNTTGLFQNIIQGDELSYDVTLKGGYYTGDYGMLGLRTSYFQEKFTGTVYRDPDTLQSNSITRGIAFAPYLRSSVPLTANNRLSFFTSVGLGFSNANTNRRDIKNIDEITTTLSNEFGFSIGLSPGITFFAMENFAFEVQLNVLGYDLKVIDTTINGEEQSRRITQNVNFKIDLLTLDLGLAYYFTRNNKKF